MSGNATAARHASSTPRARARRRSTTGSSGRARSSSCGTKVPRVTGGSRGIGRAIVRGFEAEGAVVHVNHFDEDFEGGLRYDVSDVAQVREMFARLDRVDVLVNCAGITGWTPLLDTDEATW